MADFRGLIERGAVPVVERMAIFAEARQRVLAENAANVDTPGYRAKQVDTRAFQEALRRAAQSRKSDADPLVVKDTRDVHVDAAGRMRLTPTIEPAEDAMRHDGTNVRIERLMADVAENAYLHQVSTDLLRGKLGQLMTAIRGRVGA